MRVLILGSGAREHAIAWKLSQASEVTLGCGPSNPGIADLAQTVGVDLASPPDVVRAAREFGADLVVVGPELPLVNGAVDALEKEGILAFGPSAGAARLEGSKAYAKSVMRAANVPTAEAESFEDPRAAERYARAQGRVVVKADGLAAGKGVVVAQNAEEAVRAIRDLGVLGAAAKTLVLEELLEGEEVSVIALCDSERFVLLPPAQDHKRVGEGDLGPNTGGMGAYAPYGKLTPEALAQVGQEVIAPTLRQMKKEGHPFRGALYAGLMLTAKGPKVLEFNCRLGDPETQVLMMQLQEDSLPLLVACANGRLTQTALELHDGASVAVVLAAEGYPGKVTSGDEISLPRNRTEGVELFHAGTARNRSGALVTQGGRVLTVCGRGGDLQEARAKAYRAIDEVTFRGRHFRRDIGLKGLSAP